MTLKQIERPPAAWRYRKTFQDANPTRSPAWRWKLACLVVAQQRRVSPAQDDRWVRSAVRFKRRLDRSKTPTATARLQAAEPAIVSAHEIYQVAGFPKWLLEAWLLTGLSLPAVAAMAGVAVDVAAAFEALFFNIRDRLHATGYITAYAIGRSATIADPKSIEAVVKGYAYYGGPLMLEVLVRDAIDAQGNLRPLEDLDLNSAADRTAMRARLAVMVEMLPFDHGLAFEILRIQKLIQEIERDRAPKVSLNVLSAAFEEALTCANQRADAPDGVEYSHADLTEHFPARLERPLSQSGVGREAA